VTTPLSAKPPTALLAKNAGLFDSIRLEEFQENVNKANINKKIDQKKKKYIQTNKKRAIVEED
jgi:hypothetical protein